MQRALIKSAIDTISMMCGQELSVKKVHIHKRDIIPNSIAVVLELVGDVEGKVVMRFTPENAKKTASALMCGMPVDNLDEMALSALSELGNMIMGGTATGIAAMGATVDITTPTVVQGDIPIKGKTTTLSIPLENADMRVVLDVSIKRKT